MFPSPCGDMVLKFKEQYQTIQQARVSVPLRGYGFEIMGWYIIRKDRKMFPSPCGDMVLKFTTKMTTMILLRSFRPLAGIWF